MIALVAPWSCKNQVSRHGRTLPVRPSVPAVSSTAQTHNPMPKGSSARSPAQYLTVAHISVQSVICAVELRRLLKHRHPRFVCYQLSPAFGDIGFPRMALPPPPKACKDGLVATIAKSSSARGVATVEILGMLAPDGTPNPARLCHRSCTAMLSPSMDL